MARQAQPITADLQEAPPEDHLRMRDLVRLTGVPRSTIHFYARANLLPEPLRYGRTSSLYPPATVERVRWIKRLQKEQRLTLTEIRRVLALVDQGGSVDESLSLMETLGPVHGQVSVCGRKGLRAATGLSDAQIEEALAMGLLVPTTPEEFDPEDIATGHELARILGLGAELGDLAFYRTIGLTIVDREIALRNRSVRGLGASETIRRTQELTEAARQLRSYVLQRILYEKTVLAGREIRDLDYTQREGTSK